MVETLYFTPGSQTNDENKAGTVNELMRSGVKLEKDGAGDVTIANCKVHNLSNNIKIQILKLNTA